MEKRKQKSKQRAILIGFISSLLIFLILGLVGLNIIYPDIQLLEEKKVLLKDNIDKYSELSKKGFNYDDFKVLNKKYSSTDDKNLKDLLEGNFYTTIYPNIDKGLYENSIYFILDKDGNEQNSSFEQFVTKKDFSKFLEEISQYLKKEKTSKEFIYKKDKLKKVLPVYNSILDNEKGLTDFSFINYIERLLYKFHVRTTSQIGIKNIKQVENNILDKKSDIYYIPLSLDISGTKESVLNFLQFIRNSGDIVFKNNDFTFSDKIGSTSQLSEVASMKMNEYMDSSLKERSIYEKDLLRYLYSTNQNEDSINVKLDLKFYISTLGVNNIYEKINNIIGNANKKIISSEDSDLLDTNKKPQYELLHYNYNNLLKVAKTLKSTPILNKNTFYKQKVENIIKYLSSQSLKKDMLAMKKEMKTTKNIDKIYQNALKYKKIFEKLDLEIYKIAKDLKIDKDLIDKETNKIKQKSIYPTNYIFENK